jgi:hypothetical protein
MGLKNRSKMDGPRESKLFKPTVVVHREKLKLVRLLIDKFRIAEPLGIEMFLPPAANLGLLHGHCHLRLQAQPTLSTLAHVYFLIFWKPHDATFRN